MKNKIIFVSGSFNVLHPGHIRLLRFAKDLKGKLIVGVISDKYAEKTAYINQDLRLEGISSNSLVDEAIIVDEPIENFIKKLKPDIVVKGKEHEQKFNVEKDILEKFNGQLLFSSGENLLSSMDLIRKEIKNDSTDNFFMHHNYLKRHNIKIDRLKNLLDTFSTVKVTVIGDLIIDEYIDCETLGMSQEDPSIVVTPTNSSKYIGGAGIVAAHAAGLGALSSIFTVSGDDNDKIFAEKTLSDQGVYSNIIIDNNRITTLKKRFRNKNKTLLKVTHLKQNSINNNLINILISKIEKELESSNLLIFSDFNYGVLPQKVVDHVTKLARSKKVKIVADSQSSSQFGDISRFKYMDLITPTENEARITLRNREDGLVVLADKIKKISKAKNVLLKLGEVGLLVHSKNKKNMFTDQLNTFNKNPIDPAGAGDSLLVCSALALTCGASIFEAAYLGSVGAGIQISRIGNIPLKAKEIHNKINNI
tara:strand:+ start:553 stop:1986 length:1434 start_codon:yes stop_codon:yes gene_type:complete